MAGLLKRVIGGGWNTVVSLGAAMGLLGPRLRGPDLTRSARAKVLLISLDRLGDQVMATPVIEVLGREVPDINITVLAQPGIGEIFAWPGSGVERVMDFQAPWWTDQGVFAGLNPFFWFKFFRLARRLRQEQFDLILDLRGDPRNLLLGALARPGVLLGHVEWGGRRLVSCLSPWESWYHQVDRKLALLVPLGIDPWVAGGPRRDDPRHGWPSGPVCQPPVEAVLKGGHSSGALLVDPGGKGVQCLPLACWIDVVKGLAEVGYRPIWVSAAPESMDTVNRICAEVDLATVVSCPPAGGVAELAARLAACRLVVSSDTGVAHLAAAVGTPTVTIYGPTDEKRFWCGRHGSRVVRGMDCCRPNELHLHCYQPGIAADIPGACMQAVKPAAVIATVAEVLQGEK